MRTTDLSAETSAKTDVPLSPEERLREIAPGLLRLRTPACAALPLGAADRRPHLATTVDMSGGPAAPKERAQSSQKPLRFSATPMPNPQDG